MFISFLRLELPKQIKSWNYRASDSWNNFNTREGLLNYLYLVQELNHTLIYMISALTKPVLPYTMFDEEHDKDVKKTIDKTLGLLNVRPKD